MRTKTQLPAVAPAIGFITVVVALLNADRIGEGVILAMVAPLVVRHWPRRNARTHLAEHYATHGDRMVRTWRMTSTRQARPRRGIGGPMQ